MKPEESATERNGDDKSIVAASQSDHNAAIAARDAAQRTLDAAIARRDRLFDDEPDIDAYTPSTASSVPELVSAGVAEAAGNQGALDRFGQRDREARDEGVSSYLAAHEAWEAEVDRGQSDVEAARQALNVAAARAREAGTRRSVALRSGQAVSRGRAEALQAREAAKLDAAMVASVLDWAELETVEATLWKTAVAVIAELDTRASNRITSATATEGLTTALGRYRGLRPTAINAALAEIEAERTEALEAGRSRLAETHAREVRMRLRELEADWREAQATFERELDSADRTLETAVATFRSLEPRQKTRTKHQTTLRAALSQHAASIEAARRGRASALGRRIPEAHGLTSELAATLPADALATALGAELDAGGEGDDAVGEHRELRRHADIVFRAAILGKSRARLEWSAQTTIDEGLERVAEGAEQKAESARRQLVDRIPFLVNRSEALRQLANDVRDGLYRAAGSG